MLSISGQVYPLLQPLAMHVRGDALREQGSLPDVYM